MTACAICSVRTSATAADAFLCETHWQPVPLKLRFAYENAARALVRVRYKRRAGRGSNDEVEKAAAKVSGLMGECKDAARVML